MLPNNFQAVTAVLLAVAPGFIAASVWARARTWKGPARDLRTILQSLALSTVIQLVLSPLTIFWLYPVRSDLFSYPERLLTWLALVVLVLPVAGGIAASKLTDLLFDPGSMAFPHGPVRRLLAKLWPPPPSPSVWDWLFTGRPPHGRFLVIEFKDGQRVAGVFAEGSLALTSPEPHELYLASEWLLNEDGDIVAPVPDGEGLMIVNTEDIRWIRVLEGRSDE